MPEAKDLGLANNEIVSVQKTSGTGLPGSTDTYTITLRDGTVFTFNVTNGNNGLSGLTRHSFTSMSDFQTFTLANEDNIACIVYCYEAFGEYQYRNVNFVFGYSDEHERTVILRFVNTAGEWQTITTLSDGEELIVYYFENAAGVAVVPTSRTIAGLSLENDITASQLVDNVAMTNTNCAKFIDKKDYEKILKKNVLFLGTLGSAPANIYAIESGVWNAYTYGRTALYPVSKGDKLVVKTCCYGTGDLVTSTPVFYFCNSSRNYMSSYLSQYAFFKTSNGTKEYFFEITIPDDDDIKYLAVQMRNAEANAVEVKMSYIYYAVEAAKVLEPNDFVKNYSILSVVSQIQSLQNYVMHVDDDNNPTNYSIDTTSADCKIRKYEINEEKTYFATTGGKFSDSTVVLIVYTDENDAFLGYEAPQKRGADPATFPGTELNKYPLSIPKGAKYIRLMSRTSTGYDYSDDIYPTLYVEKTLQEYFDENDFTYYKAAENVEVKNGYCNYKPDSWTAYQQLSVGNARLKKFELDLTKHYFITSGWKGQDTGFPMVVYFDESDNYLDYELMPLAGEAATYNKTRINPPAGTKYAWIHSRTIDDLDYSDEKYPELFYEVSIKEKIDEIEEALGMTPGGDTDVAKKEISILFVGNSLTQDGIAYLPYMLKTYFPEVKFKFYMWYNGGYTLAQQYQKFANDQACEIFSIAVNTAAWSNGSAKMSNILATYKFDIVCLQEYFNYKESYADSDLVDFNNCVSYITSNYAGGNALKFIELFHAPKRDNATSIFDLTKQGNGLIMQKTICEDMLANGIAVYRALSTDLNNLGDQGGLSPDGTHTQEGLPCLLQTYVTLLWVLDKLDIQKSIYGCPMRMTTAIYNTLNVPGANLGSGVITGTDAQNLLAQEVAIKAYKEGKFIVNNNLTEFNS